MCSLVKFRLLPEGDPKTQLQTLQREVSHQFLWIRQHDEKKMPVDKETYKRFMGILASSFYVFSPQGRCQGIEDLKFGQIDALLKDGYIQTTKFKTQAKWGYQPVTLAEESKELLEIYLRRYRPVAAGPLTPQPSDALLLNFIGRPYTDIGKDVSTFFTNSCNLHITPTRIRGIVETAAEVMYRAGDISLQTRKSVEAINGHTSATVQNYYLQMDRAADVHSARTFFSQANSEEVIPPLCVQDTANPYGIRVPNCDASTAPRNEVSTSAWAMNEGTKHLDWGTSHPEYDRAGARKVKWSAQELDYIEEWIGKDTQGDTNLPVSRCLSAIRLDPGAVHIFHSHHIVNSQRLRNGFESVLRKKKSELDDFINRNITQS